VAVVPVLWRYVVFGDAKMTTALLDRLGDDTVGDA
jgi:hypothetical protein